MRIRRLVLPIAVLALAGCDRITGADQQKIYDAEAIGYACRISLKTPQDCMQENETHSPTSILYGWKEADKDVQSNIIDPSMGKNPPAPQAQQSAPPAAATESKPPSGKAAESAATPKNGKPAAATAKPDQGAAEAKPVR